MRCPDPEAGKTAAAGGFMPDTGTIVMCQQWAAEQPGEVAWHRLETQRSLPMPERGETATVAAPAASQPARRLSARVRRRPLGGQVPNTVAHEMIHAYDDARARLDWTNLVHHACTEIRAANLSGDCSFWREVNRANISPLRVAKARGRPRLGQSSANLVRISSSEYTSAHPRLTLG